MMLRARRIMPWHMAGMAILSVAFLGGSAQAGLIAGIVSFGDSLSDTGNVYTYTGGAEPMSPPYYMGHFSNGPIWLEDLAGKLGVTAPTASLAGGTDNAWGGAQTGDGYSVQATPNIGLQISMFLATNTLSSNQLITIWGGANDFLNANQTNPAIVVNNLASEITTLANAGGKLFMVPNLPLLGDTPAVIAQGSAAVAAMNTLSVAFDNMLQSKLDSLQQTLGITIYQPNIEALFSSVIANPSAYGFTNVTDQLLLSNDPTQSGYLFWDIVHPTDQASPFIADVAFASMVPEPSSLTLVMIATPVVVVLRRIRKPAQVSKA
jgi:phospholipase/lecithinase/hemolysin